MTRCWCKDCKNAYSREHYRQNKEKHNTRRMKWARDNRGKQTHSVNLTRWKGKIPKNEDLGVIKQFYIDCPDDMQVDHIMPYTKGGLHTISNLQYLTPTENKRKYNDV